VEISEIVTLTDKQVKELSYEDARDALEVVVESLDDAELPLSELMKLWEVGEKIAAVCETQLKAAAKRLNDGLPTETN
jgi:exodeoxyribonuclease VII small subunit